MLVKNKNTSRMLDKRNSNDSNKKKGLGRLLNDQGEREQSDGRQIHFCWRKNDERSGLGQERRATGFVFEICVG